MAQFWSGAMRYELTNLTRKKRRARLLRFVAKFTASGDTYLVFRLPPRLPHERRPKTNATSK